jgi:NADH:ubiquinone oxidoreductase subunit C
VLQSLSKSFSSFVWVEREIKEFYNVSFLGLKDSRRLLTDYTVITPEYNSYETRGYNNIIQDLYFKGLLH